MEEYEAVKLIRPPTVAGDRVVILEFRCRPAAVSDRLYSAKGSFHFARPAADLLWLDVASSPGRLAADPSF